MFNIKLANHVFAIKNCYRFTKTFFQNYITSEDAEFDIIVTHDDIDKECGSTVPKERAAAERLFISRIIGEYFLQYDILFTHSSVVKLDSKAYMFSALSGVGKTTHTELWKERFGDRLEIITDDKPLLEFTDDGIIAHATPYVSRKDYHTNTSAKLEGIVFLHRAEENSIAPISKKEAVSKLLSQVYRPADASQMIKVMGMVSRLADLPVYDLGCTISQEAVTLAYDMLTK